MSRNQTFFETINKNLDDLIVNLLEQHGTCKGNVRWIIAKREYVNNLKLIFSSVASVEDFLMHGEDVDSVLHTIALHSRKAKDWIYAGQDTCNQWRKLEKKANERLAEDDAALNDFFNQFAPGDFDFPEDKN